MGEWRETGRGVVFPAHCDHYGHMSARWYIPFFDDAGFHTWSVFGCSHTEMRAHGTETIAARFVVDYLQEMKAGDLLISKSAFTRLGNKSCNHTHRMYNADTDTLCATLECVEVFADPATHQSVPMPDWVRERLEKVVVSSEE